jgi:hypothetical protein
MNTIFKKNNYYALFPVGFLGFYLTQLSFKWPLLNKWGIANGFNFGDLEGIIALSKCSFRNFLDQSETVSCEFRGGTYYQFPYGTALHLVIRFFRISEIHTFILGLIILILICAALTLLVKKLQIIEIRLIIFWLIIFCSPPVVLLVERMNFDAVIFLLIFLSSVLLGRSKSVAGLFILLLASLFKFYALPLLLGTLLLISDIKIKLISGVFLIISIALILNDLLVITSFEIGAFAAFGSPVFGTYLERIFPIINLSYDESRVFGLIIYLLLLFLILKLSSNFEKMKLLFIRDSSKSKIQSMEWVYIFCTIITISVYIFGNNFEYRLVFFLVASLIYLNSRVLSKLQRLTLYSSVLAISWCNYNYYILQPIGDSLLVFFLAFLSVDLYLVYFKKDLANLNFLARYFKKI